MGDTAEFARYLDVCNRELPISHDHLRAKLRGRSVLVTGATGCVGSVLVEQLAMLGPGKLVGVGLDDPVRQCTNVEYAFIDIRDGAELGKLFARTRPEVVFHLAAQRDPGLAEQAVAATVTTNVLGTANVVGSARAVGVSDLVYASTGKAMRPYTRDVYAASKKVAEWLVSKAGTSADLAVTAARFTHIVDNSIVLRRFRSWCRDKQALQIHDPNAIFYVQSAVESVQLMMISLLIGRKKCPAVCAINNLDWPFELIDIATGVMQEVGYSVAIEVIGEELGYEQGVYPGLYGGLLSGEISPLINALEASSLLDIECPEIDAVGVYVPKSEPVESGFEALVSSCADHVSDDLIKKCMDALLCDLFAASLAATSDEVIARIIESSDFSGHAPIQPSYARIYELVRERASQSKA